MKPPEPFTWFGDRSLGRRIVADLRAARFQVEEHQAHFADDALDAEWLGEAGRRGWVVLTKDKAVRRKWSGVACFSLGHGNLKAEQMAQAFIAARRRMEKALRRFDPPMTASVTVTGHVRILMAADQLLAQPREIK